MASGTIRAGVTGVENLASDDVDVLDKGLARGFGGYAGGNRHLDDVDNPADCETVPVAKAASYGPAPGDNPAYGTLGMGDQEVRGNTGKARLALGK